MTAIKGGYGFDHESLLKDVVWGARHDAFEGELGRRLLRAWSVGACDEHVARMIQDLLRPLKRREAFGELDPFRKPRLRTGELILGQDRDGDAIRVPIQWLVAGLLVAGNTGSGKTTLLSYLTTQVAASGCKVWLADMYKTQIRHWRPLFQRAGADLIVLRAPDWKINLLQPGESQPRTHLALVVDLLVRRLGLPPRARTILHRACHALYQRFGTWDGNTGAYPCLWDLWLWIRSTEGLNAAAREAILDRLASLLTALTPACGAYRFGWTAADLAKHSIDFEMLGTSELVKQTLLEPLLYSLMQAEIDRGVVNAPISLLVAFEDSQRWFDSQQSGLAEITPMDELAGVIRGSGKGLAVIVQTMQGLSRRLVPNLATKILGRMGSAEDYARLGADLALDRAQIEWARRKLRPGLFVAQVAEGDWREPFVVSVPLVRTPPVVSDEEVANSVDPLQRLPTKPATEFMDWTPDFGVRVLTPNERREDSDLDPSTEPGEVGERALPRGVSKRTLDYLQSVGESPFLNASKRDKALGLSAWKGSRIRRELCELGLVKVVAINPGGQGRRFQLLELKREGRDLLDSFGVTVPGGRGRGGIGHQYWVHTIVTWLTGQGARCRIEDDTQGARVDISVETVDGMAAVEVETSPGHELHNIRTDLRAGYVRVITLVEHTNTIPRIEADVAGAHEIQHSRVHVGCLTEFTEVVGAALEGLFLEPGRGPKQKKEASLLQPSP